MDSVVEITLPVDAGAARVLRDPARREAAGRYLSGLLNGESLPAALAEAIAHAKDEARAHGLTDAAIDAELQTWRAERQA